jgi:hypothetical protein
MPALVLVGAKVSENLLATKRIRPRKMAFLPDLTEKPRPSTALPQALPRNESFIYNGLMDI